MRSPPGGAGRPVGRPVGASGASEDPSEFRGKALARFGFPRFSDASTGSSLSMSRFTICNSCRVSAFTCRLEEADADSIPAPGPPWTVAVAGGGDSSSVGVPPAGTEAFELRFPEARADKFTPAAALRFAPEGGDMGLLNRGGGGAPDGTGLPAAEG